jgi:hypothetical protein
VFVLVSKELVMMCSATVNPTRCKISAVIRFLRVKNIIAAEIHSEYFAAVYGQNVVCDDLVQIVE